MTKELGVQLCSAIYAAVVDTMIENRPYPPKDIIAAVFQRCVQKDHKRWSSKKPSLRRILSWCGEAGIEYKKHPNGDPRGCKYSFQIKGSKLQQLSIAQKQAHKTKTSKGINEKTWNGAKDKCGIDDETAATLDRLRSATGSCIEQLGYETRQIVAGKMAALLSAKTDPQ